MPKNLSVFYLEQVGGGPADHITQITYRRPGEPNFDSFSTRFRLQSTITFPAAGMDTNRPLCVVNSKGANAPGALDLFVKTTGNAIAWITSNNGGNSWGTWNALPAIPVAVTIVSGPAASVYEFDRVVVVVLASDGQLYRGTLIPQVGGGRAFNWISGTLGKPTGKTIVGEPMVIGFEDNGYRVYVRTSDNQLWGRIFTGTTLLNWTQYPINPNDSPEGVDRWVNFNDPLPNLKIGFSVFYREAPLNDLHVAKYPEGTFTPFLAYFGGVLTSPAGAAYFAGPIEPPYTGSPYRELHAFVRGADALMYGNYATIQGDGSLVMSPAGWYNFLNRGPIWGKPDAVTWDGTANQLD